MNVLSLNPELPAKPLDLSTASRVMDLPDAKTSYRSLHATTSESAEDKARAAATSYVASAFLMPILGALHESPFELKPPFAPGTAEKRFSTMFDQQMSDRIAKASNFGLVDEIVKRYTSSESAAATLRPMSLGKEFVDVRA